MILAAEPQLQGLQRKPGNRYLETPQRGQTAILCQFQSRDLNLSALPVPNTCLSTPNHNPPPLPAKMLPSLRNSCLRLRSLPSECRSFTSATQRLSKIGRIPVVIPPEVILTPVPPPKPKNPRDTPIGSLYVVFRWPTCAAHCA